MHGLARGNLVVIVHCGVLIPARLFFLTCMPYTTLGIFTTIPFYYLPVALGIMNDEPLPQPKSSENDLF